MNTEKEQEKKISCIENKGKILEKLLKSNKDRIVDDDGIAINCLHEIK